jgi:serine/threonine protein kinase
MAGPLNMASQTRIGTEVAGFRIESVLGRGGMSVVYVAEQVRLGRKVALKVLTTELAWDEQFRERFVRESHIAATIDHPNIIPIYDAGEADGLLYIAMRFVRGPDLKEILKRGQLGVGRTIFLIEQLASALDAAHAHSLVHRDVKPGNILLEESTDHVYLTDFGVAKQTTARGLTSTGHFLGTVEYAAPEQIEGGTVDARTDVYALGCVLYECLTGAPPFSHGTEHAVLHAHLVDPPPSVSRVRPDLPQAFDGVIATAMAKIADERFGSCGELAHAARNAASGTARRVESGPGRVETIASTPAPAPVSTTPPPAAFDRDVVRDTPVPVIDPAPASREELVGAPPTPWLTPMKQLLLTLLAVVIAAAASGVIVYFLTRSDESTTPSTAAQAPAIHPLADIIPAPVWQTCTKQDAPRQGALETAVCLPPKDATTFTPDRLELLTYASGAAVQRAYEAERRRHHVLRNQGQCNGLSWGGEGTWLHNPAAPGAQPKPGGSRFCYFAGHDAVIVWTHRKFGQSTHTDLLGIAREGGSDHPGLYGWWRFWHHRLGKTLA